MQVWQHSDMKLQLTKVPTHTTPSHIKVWERDYTTPSLIDRSRNGTSQHLGECRGYSKGAWEYTVLIYLVYVEQQIKKRIGLTVIINNLDGCIIQQIIVCGTWSVSI